MLSGTDERYSIPFFQGMRRNLSKEEAVGTFKEHFKHGEFATGNESEEGHDIDSAFLRRKYDTWGETQLRTILGVIKMLGRSSMSMYLKSISMMADVGKCLRPNSEYCGLM